MKKSPYILLLAALLLLTIFFETAPVFDLPIRFLHTSLMSEAYYNPLFGTACLGGVFVYWFLLPINKKELAVFSILGLIVEALLIKWRLSIVGPVGQILHIGPGLLSAYLLAIIGRSIYHYRLSQKEELLASLEALCLAAVMPIMLGLGASIKRLNPYVYDPHCYALDSLWGGQISFIISKFFSSTLTLRLIMYAVYFYLSLYMIGAQIIVFLDNKKNKIAHSSRLVPAFFFITIAVAGSFLYNFFPVVGVQAYCGVSRFPNGPWPAANLTPVPIEAPMFLSRNGMPSLHLSWIIATLFSLYGSKIIWRRIALILTILTAISTFSVGYHYLIDLIIALPFCLAALSVTLVEASARWRLISAIYGTTAVMGWLSLFKYNITLALSHPALTTFGLTLTALLSVGLFIKLYHETQATSHQVTEVDKLSVGSLHNQPAEVAALSDGDSAENQPHLS
ncbi:MAG: phosphatase PAP2 family protein [Candidatus Bruticola sp.]